MHLEDEDVKQGKVVDSLSEEKEEAAERATSNDGKKLKGSGWDF